MITRDYICTNCGQVTQRHPLPALGVVEFTCEHCGDKCVPATRGRSEGTTGYARQAPYMTCVTVDDKEAIAAWYALHTHKGRAVSERGRLAHCKPCNCVLEIKHDETR